VEQAPEDGAMSWFRNLNTSTKLAVAFGLIEILMIGLGIFSLAQLARVNGSTEQVVNNSMPSVRVLSDLKYDTSAMRRAELSYLLAVDHKEKWTAAMKQALDDVQRHQKAYEPLIRNSDERKLYEDFSAAWAKYLSVHAQVMKLTRDNEYQAGVLAQSAGNEAFEAAAKILQEEVDRNNESAEAVGSRSAQAYSSSRYWIIGLLSCATIVGFMMATVIGRGISQAIARMLAQMREIAGNNLAIEDVEIDSKDEIGNACMALNTMKNNLRRVIQVIGKAAQQLANASEEISASAKQSAESAHIQADQAHQAATAMQEMSATVQQVSENSQKASAASQQSAEQARYGGRVAEETLSTMRSISDSTKAVAARITELGEGSQQIGKIIAVINDIADQTNLLALNAAIEAARAGEQGRGFAVVADEVRKLAERTTKATKEIAGMIESIQAGTTSTVQAMDLNGEEVAIGVEKTQASGTALQKIIEMSAQVGDMVLQIATAATQQSSASSEINNGISQIAGLTRQSAATAEQTAKACTDLSNLALDLQNLVSQFKLEGESRNAVFFGVRDEEPGMETDPSEEYAHGVGKHAAAAAGR
jgi:methyl-accepting chemotaxis protein